MINDIDPRKLLISATKDTNNYIQDGLVLHFDGIENDGKGKPHRNDINYWVDLTGIHSTYKDGSGKNYFSIPTITNPVYSNTYTGVADSSTTATPFISTMWTGISHNFMPTDGRLHWIDIDRRIDETGILCPIQKEVSYCAVIKTTGYVSKWSGEYQIEFFNGKGVIDNERNGGRNDMGLNVFQYNSDGKGSVVFGTGTLFNPGGEINISPPRNAPDMLNQIYSIVGTRIPTNNSATVDVKLYFNAGISQGVASGNNSFELLSDEKFIKIGAVNGSQDLPPTAKSNSYFTGEIYSIRIYDKRLTEAEMLYNYNIDRQRFNF